MKSRVDVEQIFDVFKNILNADRSYMRDDKQIEAEDKRRLANI